MSSSSTVMTEILLLLFRLLVIALLSPRVFSLFLIKFRGYSKDRFTLIYVLTSLNSFHIIILRFNIISKWNKHSSTRRSNIRGREKIPQTDSIKSRFLKAKHLIKLCTWSPFQLRFNLEQLCFKLLSSLSQEIFLKSQCSNVWLSSLNFVEISSHSNSTSLSFLVANL